MIYKDENLSLTKGDLFSLDSKIFLSKKLKDFCDFCISKSCQMAPYLPTAWTTMFSRKCSYRYQTFQYSDEFVCL